MSTLVMPDLTLITRPLTITLQRQDKRNTTRRNLNDCMSRLQPCIHYGGAPSYIPARSHIDSNRMKSNNNSNNKIRVQ